MKTIDFDQKIREVASDLVVVVPKSAMPVKSYAVNESCLKTALKIIADELLKDPVIKSMMDLRNNPTPSNQEIFLSNVKENIDYPTKVRFQELLNGVFIYKEATDVTTSTV
jgi:hypothetical protein